MASSSDLVRTVESALGVSVSDTLLVIVTTSVAMMIGILVLLWKISSDRSKEAVPKVLVKEQEDEVDVPSGKTKVTVFYGSESGKAEGFAKVSYI